MDKVLKQINWKGPPFTVAIQLNDNEGKYVFTNEKSTYILKLEDMNKNEEGSENEKKVLQMLLNNPQSNLPIPLKFAKTNDNINVSVMKNSGLSLDGKTFHSKFGKVPSSNNFLSAVKSIIKATYNLHSMGYIHRDITPGNVVYDTKTDEWTLIDFDFTVPFDYKELGKEVIVNPKYDYVIHPWFKLDKDDYMYFDVPRLKRYMKGTNVNWCVLIDYYAAVKVILYTFNMTTSHNKTYQHLVDDGKVLTSILNGNLSNYTPMAKKVLSLLYSIVGSFENGSKLPNATESWVVLLVLMGVTKRASKRSRDDSGDIKGTIGKRSRKKRSTGALTYTLIK